MLRYQCSTPIPPWTLTTIQVEASWNSDHPPLLHPAPQLTTAPSWCISSSVATLWREHTIYPICWRIILIRVTWNSSLRVLERVSELATSHWCGKIVTFLSKKEYAVGGWKSKDLFDDEVWCWAHSLGQMTPEVNLSRFVIIPKSHQPEVDCQSILHGG